MKTKELIAIVAKTKRENPDLEIIEPGRLSAEETAINLVNLLNSVYVSHGIAKNPRVVEEDIKDGRLKTWLAKKAGEFVATASLIEQRGGEVEIGRAVSHSKGAGKLLMAEAVLAHLKNNNKTPLVAEVRVAKKFCGIPSGAATQHICFELLSLVPHAVAPFFSHGSPKRNESFVLASNDITQGKTVSEMVHGALSGRSIQGTVSRVKIAEREPFKIVLPDGNGSELRDLIEAEDLKFQEGFTLFPIEVIDANMGLIGALLENPRIIPCGVERKMGKNNKPIVLFGTIGADTKIAPTNITSSVSQPLRRDLQTIADSFTRLGDQDMNTVGHGLTGFWRDSEGKLWGNWS